MNVLIVEDETHTAQLLKDIIEQDRNFMVVKTLDSISDTVIYLSKYHQNIDLLFLDIHLADGHSFEIFKHIDVHIPVIFCTAFDEYTLQAIKSNGIDYILKPFKDQEIHTALERYLQLVSGIREKIVSVPIVNASPLRIYQESFLTQQKDKTIVIFTKDIALFAIEHDIVYLYNFEGKKHPVFKNMEYIESVCDPQQFFRINRQMLLNRNAILSIQPYFNRKVILDLSIKTEEKAIVSRMKVSHMKEWLEKGK